eukprot:gene8488-11474_t
MINNRFLVLFCTICLSVGALGVGASSSSLKKFTPHSNVMIPLPSSNSKTSLHATSTKSVASGNDKGGEATILTSTFNLAKSIIGAGVLSLPSGVAFFADETSALLPSCLICTVFGLLAAYSFSLIGKVCEATDAKSFQDAWAKSVDPKTAGLISFAITAMCFGASLAYSIIIGDSFTSLAETFNLPSLFRQRNNVILLISSVFLLPLCSLQSLNALAPFSILGLGGTLYTALFMAVRYFDKSYKIGGKFFNEIVIKPTFNKRGGYAFNHLTFVLLAMLSSSYIAHYNAPKFYAELKNPTMPRFNTVVSGGFISSLLTFVFIMCTGFLTFGGASQGFILNNYAGSDYLATFARLAIGLALLTGYPFTFSALRDGILDIAKVTGEKRSNLAKPITIGVLSFITFLALGLKDVGFVVSIGGALFGNALMFVVPAIMNIAHTNAVAKSKGVSLTKSNKLEIGLNYGMIVTGVVMSVLGVGVSVLKQMGKI